ncbi:RagB/SusD family nutrient uptake outer membrane protein [Adhaeribacter radiodurans]|uniref:RagB/SusD family nutrient uptake outer membrane protein n=1 Tax=Adhaeribacter radiodurans TaxID=2745197 RepID=A0A7L7LA20_9BACT|nr:RagB/SusD family nutrient uptake outer membrane protein [Adhaeribacter radiodurans]QMU29692.1 RagB/SusD family nutrient uptake outer membrane protein [Adhaeribacter radiodurans]
MKKILIYPALLLSMLLFSCENFLEVESFDRVSDENTIFDKSSAETAVRGAYRSLASLNYSSGFQNTILQAGGDVRSLNNAQTDLNIINYSLRSDIGFLSTYWANFYNTINRANHVIDKVPAVTDVKLTADLKNQLLGEAYFIRAYSYFDLGRVFGNVPIYLTPTKVVADKLGVPKSSQAEVYALALADLNKAETLLPATVVWNRATKFTVYALRARLNLYLNNYEQAENDANSVLANTSYQLVKPFSLAAGTPESVLEFSYSVTDLNTGYGLWNTSNRQLEPKAVIHTLLNDPTVGGDRKILSVPNASGQFIGGIYPTNTSAAYGIRTAELYLIRAEARAKKPNPDLAGALSDLNAVRTRANVPNSTAVTLEEIILAIENERRVEFALEPHRWFDIVRTGRAPAVFNLNDPNKYIFPIPAGEILADPTLTQNPGYGN